MTKFRSDRSMWRMLGSVTMLAIAAVCLCASLFLGGVAGAGLGEMLALKAFIPSVAAPTAAMLVTCFALFGMAYNIAGLGFEMWRMRASHEPLSYVKTMKPGLTTFERLQRRAPMFRDLGSTGARMSG